MTSDGNNNYPCVGIGGNNYKYIVASKGDGWLRWSTVMMDVGGDDCK